MTTNGKLLSVALAAALLGGTAVGLVNSNNNRQADTTTPVASRNLNPANTTTTNDFNNDPTTAHNRAADYQDTALNTTDDNNVSADYRAGFNDGFNAARAGGSNTATRTTVVREAAAPRSSRVVYRAAPARTVRTSSRRAYYDYQPRSRSFWQKHRDKLTVGIGAGGGALLGGLIGGRRGAAIGALAGGGGSALYTYKIRKRNRY